MYVYHPDDWHAQGTTERDSFLYLDELFLYLDEHIQLF